MDPQRLGSRYLLETKIGEGGLGVVWRGRDISDETICAIKLLRPEQAKDEATVARFVRERNALLRFRHPNVVTLYDMIVEGDRLALVMDFVAGGDLDGYRRRRGGALPPAEAMELTGQICSALSAAHAAGIVHRDLKPANVLFDDGQVRLTDFGIARISGDPTVTSTGTFVGTLSYLAPEVIAGREPEPACDIYAAGITLYELLSGTVPFVGQSAAVLYSHLQAAPPRPGGIPDALWGVIAACLAKDPVRRPAAAELEAVLRGPSRPATVTSGWHAVQQPSAWDHTQARPAVPSGTTSGMSVASAPFMAAPTVTRGAAFVPPSGASAVATATGARWAAGERPGPAGPPAPEVPGGSGKPRRPGSAAGSRRRWAWAGGLIAVLVAAGAVTFAVTRPPGAQAPSATRLATVAPSAAAAPPAVLSTASPSVTPSTVAKLPKGWPAWAADTPSSTVPVNSAWSCGIAEAATINNSVHPYTGQTIQACTRVYDGKLDVKGTVSPAVTGWDEQIVLILKDPGDQDHGSYVSPVCTVADCTFTDAITPPSSGYWSVLPQWERSHGYESTGHESDFVYF